MGNPHDPHATLARLKRVLGLLCVTALVFTGACCHFGSSKSSPTTLLGDGEQIGGGLTTSATAAPTTTTAAKVTTTAPPKCMYSDPTSEIVYGNRIKMNLTTTPLCPQHATDITFKLVVTNVSNAVVHYDRNQNQFFSLLAYPQGSGRIRWEDANCQPRVSDGTTTAGNLGPGASITFDGLYPGLKSAPDREKCRRLEAGGYSANAVFLTCDGAAYTDGYCDISKDTQFQAAPILLNVLS